MFPLEQLSRVPPCRSHLRAMATRSPRRLGPSLATTGRAVRWRPRFSATSVPSPRSSSADDSFDSRSARTLWLDGEITEATIRRSTVAEGAFETDRPVTDLGELPVSRWSYCGLLIWTPTEGTRHAPATHPGQSRSPRTSRFRLPGQSRVVRTADGRRVRLSVEPPHVQIFGDDNRFEIYPIDYPAHCVCHLKLWTRRSSTAAWESQGEGTGFLAGRRVCVTASHLWPEGSFAEWKIDVIPGDYVVGVSTMGIKAHTNAHSVRRAPADVGSDIMVLGLYDAVGDLAGYFGTKGYTDDWEDWNVWSMAGYPYDHPGVPTAQTGISIYDDDDGPTVSFPEGGNYGSLQLESYADEASGLSGAPLFSWFEDGLPVRRGSAHRT